MYFIDAEKINELVKIRYIVNQFVIKCGFKKFFTFATDETKNCCNGSIIIFPFYKYYFINKWLNIYRKMLTKSNNE